MGYILGLDIGTRNIKAVLLEDTGKGFKAIKLESLSRDQWELTGPRTFLKQAHLPFAPVVSTFPSSLCSFRDLTLPSADRSPLDEAVKYACEKLLPHPIDDLVVGFEHVGKTEGGESILAAAALKRDLQLVAAPLEAARIELIGLLPDAAAIWALARLAPSDPDRPAAVLDIGASSSKLAISQEGQRPFLKAIRGGPIVLAEAPATSMEDPDKQSTGLEELPESLKPTIDKLADELTRAFLLAPSPVRPAKLWLCGGGALLPGVQQELSAKLDMPVETADVLAWIGSSPEGNKGTIFAAAIGAAIAGFRRKRMPLDLLKEEFRPRSRVRKLAAPLTTALVLVALSLAVLLVSRLAFNARLNARLQNTLSRQRQIGRQVLGLETTGGSLSIRLESKLKELQRMAQNRTPMQGISALSTLRDLAGFIPAGGAIKIQSLNITQGGMAANMLAASRSDIDQLLDAINASGRFIANTGETVQKNQKISFTLEVEYQAPQ